MLRKKQAGFKPPKGKEKPAAPTNVVNLMDALRKSIAEGRGAAPKKAKKRIEGQREMLLPIAGKKAAEAAKKVAEPAKKVARQSGRQKKAG
jgi:DNA end-binding protein Ku